jgi:hypothetical protein
MYTIYSVCVCVCVCIDLERVVGNKRSPDQP